MEAESAPRARGASKVYADADEAVRDLKPGSVILSAGFGLCGVAETIIRGIRRNKKLQNLTAVSINAGSKEDSGLGLITDSGQVDRLILSHTGVNRVLEKRYLSGDIAIELCPQGTLAERIRCAGAGIPGFYTPTGCHTFVQTGNIPHRFGSDGRVVESGRPRETRIFDGKMYCFEQALKGDVAILHAYKVDAEGNCQFRLATKGFGPLMAKAARVAIVEAENIVPTGSIDPNDVDLPGIFIDRIVLATSDKKIETRKTRCEIDSEDELTPPSSVIMTDAEIRRHRVAKRAAKELKHGYYVNLGVGMPTMAPAYLPRDRKVWIQSENGLLGVGMYPTEKEVDADLVNASKETVTLVPGASCFDSSDSFGMIRGGHIDVSILGTLQVGANGDLANYMIPGKIFRGMGGAMDLISNPDETKIVVTTEHVARDGTPKIVSQCSLPLTGAGVVSTIITDLCVFQVDRVGGTGLELTELARGVTVEEIQEKTGATFRVADVLLDMERDDED